MLRLSLDDMGEIHGAEDFARMRELSGRMLFDLVIVLRAGLFQSGEVVRFLRPEGLKRPAVYVISWQQAEQTVLSLLESGVDQYMTFPLSLHRLRVKVANELNR